ncbi:hypothetical protein F5X99DRAFT_410060 [Biscogniauxia marginata]|nr:hypothetical protein F5X99DRAFT_410060 [Biscogniauxia marginata]
MKSAFAVVIATFAAIAATAPLNINLGAYSPALVVGDGAISFLEEEEGGAANEEAAAVADYKIPWVATSYGHEDELRVMGMNKCGGML